MGRALLLFPSQIDLECGRFWICVWAELIESPKNLAALTPGQCWHRNTDMNTSKYTHMLPFVSFSAKPNPVLPAAENRETERESPPSIQFQFTFQFQGALLARVCLSDAKVINKKSELSKQKERT